MFYKIYSTNNLDMIRRLDTKTLIRRLWYEDLIWRLDIKTWYDNLIQGLDTKTLYKDSIKRLNIKMWCKDLIQRIDVKTWHEKLDTETWYQDLIWMTRCNCLVRIVDIMTWCKDLIQRLDAFCRILLQLSPNGRLLFETEEWKYELAKEM